MLCSNIISFHSTKVGCLLEYRRTKVVKTNFCSNYLKKILVFYFSKMQRHAFLNQEIFDTSSQYESIFQPS